MEKRTSSFEDHLSVIESGHSKTASKTLGKSQNDSLLAKLAAELGMDKEEKTPEATTEKAHEAAEAKAGEAAPTAEGQRELAGENVASASTEVSAATDGVAVPQVIAAGGDPIRAEAGMAPHVMAPQGTNPVIATGENTAKDAQTISKTPDAVVAAARGAGGAQTGKLESAAVSQQGPEAEKIGQLIAKSFQETLEKNARDAEYTEALNFLKEAGLLDQYNIKDNGIEKTASYQPGALEKIANVQALTRDDVINAAIEYSELQKEAADAEAQGRADAHAYVEMYEEMKKTATAEVTETEKVASLKADPSVVGAMKVLKDKGLL